jgi:hypothetical protein
MERMNQTLFNENIFRKCKGDRETTRNTLDIKPGQIILVRRGLKEFETKILVSMISQNTNLK